LRWLVEVFIQDWKGFEGWNQLAKQQGEKGSTRGVILSLLCDHLLLHHPKQTALLKNQQPGMPVGCLIEHLNAEALVETLRKIVTDEKPLEKFKLFAENLGTLHFPIKVVNSSSTKKSNDTQNVLRI